MHRGVLTPEPKEQPLTAISKIMVFNTFEYFKLIELYHNLGFLGITSINILSINLREDLGKEVFQIKTGGISATYVEMGINYFINMLNQDPVRFFITNKKTLYIFRDTTYSDINYILGFIGQYGIKLVRGSNQKSHVISPLELRFMFYLMALTGDGYRSMMKLNSFDVLGKIRYLPTYKP